MEKKPLTLKQQQILDFIKSFIASTGWPPSTRDIQSQFKYKSQTAAMNHLRLIELKHHIERPKGIARGIRIL